jgi:hypothetical protein
MKRGDIPGLTFGTVLGVLFTFIFILLLFKSTAIADVLFGIGDDKLVQSLEGLEREIYEIGLNEEKNILFYFSEDTKAVLMIFNQDPGNPKECYGSACMVICDNEKCDNVHITIPFSEDIEFLNPGLVFSLETARSSPTGITVRNVNGKIDVSILGVDCSGVFVCTDYEKNELACNTNPCNVGQGQGCSIHESGKCIDETLNVVN